MLPSVAYEVRQAAREPGTTPAHRIEQMGIKRGAFGGFSGSDEAHGQYSFPFCFLSRQITRLWFGSSKEVEKVKISVLCIRSISGHVISDLYDLYFINHLLSVSLVWSLTRITVCGCCCTVVRMGLLWFCSLLPPPKNMSVLHGLAMGFFFHFAVWGDHVFVVQFLAKF